jgi:hypothetical protein
MATTLRSSQPPLQRNASERGSALLIVFVFAAVIAIMLYRELPSVTMEAERQREQELQDRGQEYVRAVQLFYRKNQRYPGSIEALENTNRVRYLRQRFKDPLTGKDDWRLLHAGPGGMLIDSKIKRVPLAGQGTRAPGTGQSGAFGNSASVSAGQSGFGNSNGQSGFGNSASSTGQSSFGNSASSNGQSGFGNSGSATGQSGFGNSSGTGGTGTPSSANGAAGAGSTFGAGGAFADSTFSDSGQPVASLYRQRAPATAPSGGSASGAPGTGAPSTAALDADPTTPLVPSTDSNTGPAGDLGANGTPNPSAAPNGQGTPAGANGANTAAGPNGANTPAGTAATQAVGSLLQNGALPNNGASTGAAGSGQLGQLNSGGLAGVASKAKGRTIKKFADQKDFSLWEFFYDPNQDTSMSASGSSGPAGGAVNATGNGTGNNSTGFGQNTGSGFGQSNSTGFGQNNSTGFGQSNSSGFGQNSGTSFGSSGQDTSGAAGANGNANPGTGNSQQPGTGTAPNTPQQQ